MTTYTSIPKPVGTTYINQNTIGKEQYDQSSIQYDDASIFYDGINASMYTFVSKPNGFGLLQWLQMIFPWTNATQTWGENNDGYTRVPKPTS